MKAKRTKAPETIEEMAQWQRADLREDVALMRELGVVEWKGIKLGAAPVHVVPRAPRTPEELHQEMEERRRSRHRTQFAASSFMPPFMERQATTVAPRAVVARNGRPNGRAVSQ